MFKMKIKKQLNLKDRTLLLGTPEFNEIPDEININSEKIRVLGISPGVKFPYVSLEIERIENDLVDMMISK